MSLTDDIRDEVAKIYRSRWDRRDGRVVPEAEDLGLGNEGVDLDGAVLYADLVDSTAMVNGHRAEFAAEIYKAYLIATCRIIRANEGEITAFDGDRVMAVFLGGNKNSSAARAGLQINHIVKKIVNPEMLKQYPTTTFKVSHVVGVDSGKLLVARTGIRNANDLVWVGRAANFAAKLCGVRGEGCSTYITEGVYKKLSEASKYGGSPREDMWKRMIWDTMGVAIYGSSWMWDPE